MLIAGAANACVANTQLASAVRMVLFMFLALTILVHRDSLAKGGLSLVRKLVSLNQIGILQTPT
ncbi:hypothetical protein AGR6A_pb0050 [Agrobacterium sp. NCPPB 925]|nr:hypothetical protein AGR6A_pb0050 [Agrobacterium sp. NCPPB 925]